MRGKKHHESQSILSVFHQFGVWICIYYICIHTYMYNNNYIYIWVHLYSNYYFDELEQILCYSTSMIFSKHFSLHGICLYHFWVSIIYPLLLIISNAISSKKSFWLSSMLGSSIRLLCFSLHISFVTLG